MREHFGPGWRMYYVQRGAVLIIMLGGGEKSSQAADIAKAVKLSGVKVTPGARKAIEAAGGSIEE